MLRSAFYQAKNYCLFLLLLFFLCLIKGRCYVRQGNIIRAVKKFTHPYELKHTHTYTCTLIAYLYVCMHVSSKILVYNSFTVVDYMDVFRTLLAITRKRNTQFFAVCATPPDTTQQHHPLPTHTYIHTHAYIYSLLSTDRCAATPRTSR